MNGYRQYYVNDVVDRGQNVSIVKKFGGDNARQTKANAGKIKQEADLGIHQNVVTSAFKQTLDKDATFKTTDTLISVAENISQFHLSEAVAEFESIKEFYLGELVKDYDFESRFGKSVQKYTQKQFDIVLDCIKNYDETIIPTEQNDYRISDGKGGSISLLGFGEIISAKINTWCLKHEGVNAKYIDTSYIEGLDQSDHPAAFLKDYFHDLLLSIYEEDSTTVGVFGGYIGGYKTGILDVLGRSYSDVKQERLTVAMHDTGVFDSVISNVQKIEPGVLSTDPRELSDKTRARLLSVLSYGFMDGVASRQGANAVLLNEQALTSEIKARGIEIYINNPLLDTDGTRINKASDQQQRGIKMVARRSMYVNRLDDMKFGKKSKVEVGGEETDEANVLFLLGEDTNQMFDDINVSVIDYLSSRGVEVRSSYIDMIGKTGISYSFGSKKQANLGLNLLHELLIEEKQKESQAA